MALAHRTNKQKKCQQINNFCMNQRRQQQQIRTTHLIVILLLFNENLKKKVFADYACDFSISTKFVQ